MFGFLPSALLPLWVRGYCEGSLYLVLLTASMDLCIYSFGRRSDEVACLVSFQLKRYSAVWCHVIRCLDLSLMFSQMLIGFLS